MRALRLAPLALIGLAACRTVGADYRVPPHAMANAPDANAPFRSGHNPAFAQAPLPPHWWRLYDDPALDALVTEALDANADLRAADADLRRAAAVVREAQAGALPATTLSGGVTLARPEGSTQALPGTLAYSLGGSVSYPLDLFGRIRRAVEAATADAEATAAARDEVKVTVAAAVTRNYAAACSANRTLDANRRVLTIERRTLDATQRLFRGGRGTAFDVARAQAAVDQSAAAIPSILAQRQAALYALGALLGRAPADYPRAVESCAAPPTLKQLLPIGDGSALIRRRPDIREAERTLAAATATIGVETAGLYPSVSLGGSAGLGGPFSGIGGGSSFGFSLGPLISWSFPNRAVAHARIAEAGAATEAAEARFDGSVIEALRQTETALDAYARAIEQVRDLARARDSAAKAADQADKLFRFGRTDFLSVLSAEANLANAEATLAQARTALVDRQIDVFLALGGGWEA